MRATLTILVVLLGACSAETGAPAVMCEGPRSGGECGAEGSADRDSFFAVCSPFTHCEAGVEYCGDHECTLDETTDSLTACDDSGQPRCADGSKPRCVPVEDLAECS